MKKTALQLLESAMIAWPCAAGIQSPTYNDYFLKLFYRSYLLAFMVHNRCLIYAFKKHSFSLFQDIWAIHSPHFPLHSFTPLYAFAAHLFFIDVGPDAALTASWCTMHDVTVFSAYSRCVFGARGSRAFGGQMLNHSLSEAAFFFFTLLAGNPYITDKHGVQSNIQQDNHLEH